MIRNIAIVLAGGVGSRLGLSTPKQFFKVAGKMVIEHTLDTFEHNTHIDEIVIVSNPVYVSDVENIVLRNGWKKLKDTEGRQRALRLKPFGHSCLRRR